MITGYIQFVAGLAHEKKLRKRKKKIYIPLETYQWHKTKYPVILN